MKPAGHQLATFVLSAAFTAPALCQGNAASAASEPAARKTTMTLKELEPVIRGQSTPEEIEIFSATSAQAEPRDENLLLELSFQPIPETLAQRSDRASFVSEIIRVALSGPDMKDVNPDRDRLYKAVVATFREFYTDYIAQKPPTGTKPDEMSQDQWLFNHHMQRFADRVQTDHGITVTVIAARRAIKMTQSQTPTP